MLPVVQGQVEGKTFGRRLICPWSARWYSFDENKAEYDSIFYIGRGLRFEMS